MEHWVPDYDGQQDDVEEEEKEDEVEGFQQKTSLN